MSSTVIKQIVTEVIPLLSQSAWIGTRYDSYLYIIRGKHLDLMDEVLLYQRSLELNLCTHAQFPCRSQYKFSCTSCYKGHV